MVQCTHCRGTYDVGHVEVVARYSDCSVFKAPCCGRTVDDRAWKSLPDYREMPAVGMSGSMGILPGGYFDDLLHGGK